MLPIVAYGNPSLRELSIDIEPDYPGLHEFIEEMYKSLAESDGVGLAAPQVGQNINLFIIDSTILSKNPDKRKIVFINPILVEFAGKPYAYEEGCLSLPGIREDVTRDEKVLVNWLDENFDEHEEWFDAINARIIQHEYDHLIGKLFIDKISPLRKRLIKKKLEAILNGTVECDYPMKFFRPKKK